jgi:uncharacterized membrane protein
MKLTSSRSPAVWIALAGGILVLVLGIWAFTSPRSFYKSVATWPPFNRHFIHDLGALQIGIGATLLLAALRSDALFVALTGAAIGAGFHFVSHVMDRDLGGKSSDPIVFGLIAVVLAYGAYSRGRARTATFK